MQIILVGLFGLVGVYTRYFLNTLVHNIWNFDFAIATLAINIIGSFLMGILYALSLKSALLPEDLRIALMAGLNLASELLKTEDELILTSQNTKESLLRLMRKVDLALDQSSVLESNEID